MPPRISPEISRSSSRGSGGPGRGGGGGARGRGRGGRGGPPPSGISSTGGTGITVASHIQAIGVKRPDVGTSGRPLEIAINAFEADIPDCVIHHYDVVISAEKNLPVRMNMEIIKRLQTVVAPQIFSPPAGPNPRAPPRRAVYDGRKNMFASFALPFPGGAPTKDFDVTLSDAQPSRPGGRGPRIYRVKLTKVAEVNAEVLHRFVHGQQSNDNVALTALTALNVVIRMEPSLKYPFNVRSFFTDREKKEIGSGIVLWRGYFQSVRPAIGRMLINVDISTGCMYKPGRLVDLCLEFLRLRDARGLARAVGSDRDRIHLQRFLANLRVKQHNNNQMRVIKKITKHGADELSFTMQQTGKRITVSDYFRQHQNKPLQYPFLPCVEVSSGALVPFELCDVPPGQIMRKQVPSERTKDVLDFATKRPSDRLASINAGLSILNYGQSEYMAAFGMQVNTAAGPIKVQARVLKPPTLKYGPGSRQPTIVPNAGSWNMVDKKFFKAATIRQFVMAIYEQKGRFPPEAANDVVRGLVQCCKQVGMGIADNVAALAWENGQGDITKQLRDLGNECKQKTGIHPDLIVAILPEGASDIYHAIKHFGDVKAGVATQCLKSTKCFRAKPQYYANVCLKMNVKMGGINTIPEPMSVSALTDPRNPTLVLGADVIHPAPGSDGRPSFTALVGNVDSDTAKYIATIQVQASRQEMIEDLYEMSKHILSFYMRYRDKMEKKGANSPPKRIIFYRDGVSEGQFRQVLELELPKLQAACRDLNINAKITVIVVGKRHHYRMFPLDPRDADRSGNCPAGTVVDQGIAHPVEFDFYLQSHGGLLGTSRPAHYNVLYDENNFTADGLQSLSYALCHVYARSTRSVSIPAPVYYADIVCSRAKNHYEPSTGFDFSESATQLDSGQAMSSIEKFKQNFRPLHQNMATVMYFS